MEQNRCISLLGSTGSIGRQSLDVIAACGMRAAALTANRSVRELEEQAGREPAMPRQEDEQVSLANLAEEEVLSRLRREQVDTLSPIEALNLLYELKQKLQ